MPEEIRVGVVGAGSIVRGWHLPVLQRLPGVKLEWICDHDVDRARELAAAFKIPACYGSVGHCPDIDIALLAIPVGSRRAVMEEILPRGWHAFCEKPFAPTLADHKWMVEEAERQGVRLGVGLQRRQFGSTHAARRVLLSGIIGPVELIIAGEGRRIRNTGRSGDWYQASASASGGGVLVEWGSHLVDQVFTICRVSDFRIEQCSQQIINGLEFETSVQGTVSLAGQDRDVRLAMVVTRLHDVYNGVVIRCAGGELRLGPEAGGAVELLAADGVVVARLEGTERPDRAWQDAIRREWEDFMAACSDSPAFSDWDTGVLNTAFMEACYRFGAKPDGRARANSTIVSSIATEPGQ
jgi:predicted dehydrogenase